MEPPFPPSIIAFAATWVQRKVPLRFTSWTASQSSSVSSRKGTRGKIPALLTRPPSPREPPSSTPASTIRRIASGSVTLPRTSSDRAPAAATSSATDRAPASSSSQLTTTCAPSLRRGARDGGADPLLRAGHRDAHPLKPHASPPFRNRCGSPTLRLSQVFCAPPGSASSVRGAASSSRGGRSHRRRTWPRRERFSAPDRRAMKSISTRTPRASAVTPMQVRAGSRSAAK